MMNSTHSSNGRASQLRQPSFIGEALSLPDAALAYRISAELAARYPERTILESADSDFDVEAYARAGLCQLSAYEQQHLETSTYWDVENRAILTYFVQGWYRVVWQEQTCALLRLTFNENGCPKTVRWLITATSEQAQAFFRAVAQWNSAIEKAIMIFQDGYWQKSTELYQAIQNATMENLVLGGTLKDDMHRDLASFFAAREVYARSGVPWKRGIVLIGPPGNGKTHTIKALLNALHQPCLYVKSFSSRHDDDHAHIRTVFAKARESAPCILVLEDLDSLITDHNRSFFLNELDGFASNEGIVTLASTNHPERLDPAIMARPSRFDRKYHFELPQEAERLAYLQLWRARLDDAMRPSEACIASLAAQTDGFSFAYIKELMVAATVRWAELQQPDSMDITLQNELIALRTQMRSSQG